MAYVWLKQPPVEIVGVVEDIREVHWMPRSRSCSYAPLSLLIARKVFDFVKRNHPERSGGGRPKLSKSKIGLRARLRGEANQVCNLSHTAFEKNFCADPLT